MGFFTIVAWVVVVMAFLTIGAIVHEYRKCKRHGLGEVYLNNIEIRQSFLWALIVSLCWLGWRYFGA